MSKIVDVRGDEHGPLLGRLRGVTARHELREVVTANDHNYFVAHDAHMAFHGDVPAALPDLISTSERQLVVSKRLAEALRKLDPEIALIPVRLVDRAGKTVESDHSLAVVKAIASLTPASDDMSPDGYFYAELRGLAEPKEPLPPLFRVMYSLVIGCNPAAAKVLGRFSGVPLVALLNYVEVVWPRPRLAYVLLTAGTTGASFSVDKNERTEALELGEDVRASWPKAAPSRT